MSCGPKLSRTYFPVTPKRCLLLNSSFPYSFSSLPKIPYCASASHPQIPIQSQTSPRDKSHLRPSLPRIIHVPRPCQVSTIPIPAHNIRTNSPYRPLKTNYQKLDLSLSSLAPISNSACHPVRIVYRYMRHSLQSTENWAFSKQADWRHVTGALTGSASIRG